MESLDVVFRLLDRVSPTLDVMDGHLASTKRSLSEVDKALRALDRSEKQAHFANERDPMKRYRLGLELMKDDLTQAKGGVGGLLSSFAMFGGVSGLVMSAANTVTSAVTGIAQAAVEGAVGLTRFAIQSASFKRDSMTAFELIESGADAARESFNRLSDLADKTPFRTDEVITFGKVLRSTDFSLRETEDLLAGMFDVGAVQGKEGPEQVRRLLEGITKIKGRNVINMESLESILGAGSAAGVNLQSLSETLAERRNLPLANATKLLTSGQIKATEGIDILLETIRRKTDKGKALGSATLEFGQKSLDGQLSTLSSRFQSIFYDVDIQPLVDVLRNVNELLSKDSPTGQRIREFASTTLGGMFKTAREFLTPENIEQTLTRIIEVADKTKGAFLAGKDAIGAFVGGFGEGFDTIPDKFHPLDDAVKGFNEALGGAEAKNSWAEFGRALGLIVRLVTELGEALVWVESHVGLLRQAMTMPLEMAGGAGIHAGVAGLSAIVGSFHSGKASSPPAAPTAPRPMLAFERYTGLRAAEGIAAGIKDGQAAVDGAATALALGAVQTTADTLEIHSPSRAMRRLGVFTAEGYADGVESVDVDPVMSELTAAPRASVVPRRPSTSGAVTVTIGDVVVHLSTDNPTEAGREIARSLRAELVTLLEEMAFTT